jgi:hypothetical protein
VIIPGTLLAVLSVLAAGCGLTLALWRRPGPILAAELFGLSWLFGAGFISLLLALAGTALGGGALISVVAIACLALGGYGARRWRQGVRIETGLAGALAWEKWLAVLALLPIVYFGWAAFRDAMLWDGLFIWEAKARHAFLAGGFLPASSFQDASRLRYHPSYPLYVPFTELWVYLCAGDAHQTAVKSVLVLFYASAIALLWSSTLRLGGRLWVAAVTALLPLFVPFMADHGLGLVQGYADFLLGAVYLAGVGGLLAWRFRQMENGWAIAAACAALLPWIKQEGILLLASLLVQAALSRGWRGWKQILFFAAPGLAVAIAWRVALRLLHVQEETTFHPFTIENLMAGLSRLGSILYYMGAQFSLIKNWSLLWYLAPVALLGLACQRRREVLWLALAIFLPLGLDIIPYLFTTLDLKFHIITSMDRLILQVSLVAVLAIGLALEGSRGGPVKENSESLPDKNE